MRRQAAPSGIGRVYRKESMKLNMGCNTDHRPGYVNVDKYPGCNPDLVVDLERFPWPWLTNSIEEICFAHCLEHLGQQTNVYLNIIQEVYRVCAPDAIVDITVPHPRHDSYLNDPTHVRPITIEGLMMFDRKLNDEWIASGIANTPLAHHLGVDFETIYKSHAMDARYSNEIMAGRMTLEEVQQLAITGNNVIIETQIKLRARK